MAYIIYSYVTKKNGKVMSSLKNTCKQDIFTIKFIVCIYMIRNNWRQIESCLRITILSDFGKERKERLLYSKLLFCWKWRSDIVCCLFLNIVFMIFKEQSAIINELEMSFQCLLNRAEALLSSLVLLLTSVANPFHFFFMVVTHDLKSLAIWWFFWYSKLLNKAIKDLLQAENSFEV